MNRAASLGFLFGFAFITWVLAHAERRAVEVIPVSCIDRVIAGTKNQTSCEVLGPDTAICKQIIVHFNCVKVAK